MQICFFSLPSLTTHPGTHTLVPPALIPALHNERTSTHNTHTAGAAALLRTSLPHASNASKPLVALCCGWKRICLVRRGERGVVKGSNAAAAAKSDDDARTERTRPKHRWRRVEGPLVQDSRYTCRNIAGIECETSSRTQRDYAGAWKK